MFLALEEFKAQQEPLDIACAQRASSAIFGTPRNFLCLFFVISFVLLPFTGSLCLLRADYFILKSSMLLVAYKSAFLYYNSVQSLSCIWLRPHGLQHVRLPCPTPTPQCAQTHVHQVSDAIQPSHPLSSPSPPAFNLPQHQSLFQWVSSSHQEVKVLEFQL